MKELRAVRLLCAANGDTKAESTLFSSIVSELNQGIALDHHLHFEPSFWDTDKHPRFQPDPPPSNDDSKLQVENYDVLICIFWTRFGSVTVDNISAKYEIERVYGTWRKHGSPQVLSYFNKSELFPTSDEEGRQLKEVEDFKQTHQKNLEWWHYGQLSELKRLIRNHIVYLVKDQLSIKSVRLEQSPITTFNVNDREYLNFVAGLTSSPKRGAVIISAL